MLHIPRPLIVASMVGMAVVLLLSTSAYTHTESDLQKILCQGKQIEITLQSGAIADCIDDEFAIEIDFTDHWAEALGQSLHYSAVTGKKPAIYLICKSGESNCLSHKLRLEETIRHWDLEVEVFVFEENEIIQKSTDD